ncbi:MAG: cyclic nucleotide-binding domain-containing protein [Verrucomicrobiae bacterium]|nr:cyclic nucleotide-binding domain-containing protein [Verrucomicrobiae bacterium]
MAADIENFYVFAEDRQTYGPADANLLREWAMQGSVSAESWVYSDTANAWSKAKELPILKDCLTSPTPHSETIREPTGLKGSQLRRIRLFSDMSDTQAEQFVNLVEKIKVRAFQAIVKQGEHGDSMFLILEGEARVFVSSDGKENAIATLGVGDFFGEMALLDAGPRSANVSANKDSTLLKLSKAALEQLVMEKPDLSARFLMAMNRLLSGRIRQTNDRFTKAQLFNRGASGQVNPPSSMRWTRQ